MGACDIVGIEAGDEAPSALREAFIQGGDNAPGWGRHHSDTRVFDGDEVGGVVLASVVDDDDLQIRVLLRTRRADRPGPR